MKLTCDGCEYRCVYYGEHIRGLDGSNSQMLDLGDLMASLRKMVVQVTEMKGMKR
ncbi:MAG: hypothetical protein SFV81_03855 [Pirellulaceae bacterium]|nr:hypothetical protein [Pirellulaceae bacterium]